MNKRVLDSLAKVMLAFAWADKRMIDVCQNQRTRSSKGSNFSPDCSMILAGTWQDPAILDGLYGSTLRSFLIAHVGVDDAPHVCFVYNVRFLAR